ncbi:hypothetical protein SAMN06298216_2721 [Spirosomataceae bacterium TFI 002]|nr:hypothetical protein SAMN06298216_2721 [Spirosomataceae bacterium TFI 002]
MPKNISKELEGAILALPLKEQNRLLLRLIAKNDILIEQLHYKLLETPEDLPYRKGNIKEDIDEKLKYSFRYPTEMLWEIKRLNSSITRYRRVTTDKYGEVELGLYLIGAVLSSNINFLEILSSRTEKLSLYLVKRMIMILKNLSKLDREYYIDFEKDVSYILDEMHKKITRIHARQLDLPTKFEI